MRTPIIEGRSIEQFIPANLMGMFYKNAIPQYKYAIHDGYDPYGFSTEGLVLYLPLWALKDSAFKSVDAYKQTCTVATPTWQPDGRLFDGAADTIGCGDVDQLHPIKEMTLEYWVKATTIDHLAVVTIGRDVDSRYLFSFQASGTQLTFGVYCAGIVETDTAIDKADYEGIWKHIVGTYDGSDVHLIVDGSLLDSDNQTGNQAPTRHGVFYVGSHTGGGEFFKGIIGEVRMYNRALSVAEVAHNRNCTIWRYG